MTRTKQQITLAALAAVISLAPRAWADEWRRDAWHHVVEGTPFYTEQSVRYHGAGLLQSDGIAVVFLLGAPDQGGLITLNLPGRAPFSELNSTLSVPGSGDLQRLVAGSQLSATPARDGESFNYSFRIASADIQLFMATTTWTVRAGDTDFVITLEDSADALKSAMEARSAEATTAAVPDTD